MNSITPTYNGSEAIIPLNRAGGTIAGRPYDGEKITGDALIMGIKMAFIPSLTRTIAELERFEDLDIDNLRRTVRGLIIDVEGTLTCDGNFEPEVVEKLREIREKIPACIYCKDNRTWPIFEQLSIPVAKNIPNKPDPRGFIVAMQMYLQYMKHGTKLIHPQEVAMIGDNRLTDGGCRNIGMQFIHVKRRSGPEKRLPGLIRLLGESIAGFHRQLGRIRQKISPERHMSSEESNTPNPLTKALYEKRPRRKPL